MPKFREMQAGMGVLKQTVNKVEAKAGEPVGTVTGWQGLGVVTCIFFSLCFISDTQNQSSISSK